MCGKFKELVKVDMENANRLLKEGYVYLCAGYEPYRSKSESAEGREESSYFNILLGKPMEEEY